MYIHHKRQWGAKMGTIASVTQHVKPHDPEPLKTELAWYPLTTISGTAGLSGATWDVILSTDGHQIRRDAWLDGIAWGSANEGWEPEGTIWPAWPVGPFNEMSPAEVASFTDVQRADKHYGPFSSVLSGWRNNVESYKDFHLPCDVNYFTRLRGIKE